MQKYIFIRDLHFVTKKENIRYKKGTIIHMEEDVALNYIKIGVLTKYSITVAEIKGQLEELGIAFSYKHNKQELLDLLDGVTNVNN